MTELEILGSETEVESSELGLVDLRERARDLAMLRLLDPERKKELDRGYRLKIDPAKARERGRLWYRAHPARVKARRAVYNAKFPDKARERHRRWAAANPEKVRAQEHRRRAHKIGGGERHTFEEFQALCETFGHRCLACGRERKLTVDHIIPLSKGGSNALANVQPLCKPCNSRKGTKTIDYRPSGS